MVSLPSLTSTQLDDYKNDGFLVVRGELSADKISMKGVWADKYKNHPPDTDQNPDREYVCRV